MKTAFPLKTISRDYAKSHVGKLYRRDPKTGKWTPFIVNGRHIDASWLERKYELGRRLGRKEIGFEEFNRQSRRIDLDAGIH